MLADRADPIVSNVALCRKVVTFGVYEEMSDEDFVAGRTNPTIVYSEIRNLRSEPVEGGQYRTQLGTRIEILTVEGDSVWLLSVIRGAVLGRDDGSRAGRKGHPLPGALVVGHRADQSDEVILAPHRTAGDLETH